MMQPVLFDSNFDVPNHALLIACYFFFLKGALDSVCLFVSSSIEKVLQNKPVPIFSADSADVFSKGIL